MSRSRNRGNLPRVLLVLFFCAGIAMLGLLGGGEHRAANARLESDPMLGYFPEGMPRYPRAQEVPAGKNSQIGGAHVRMAYFDTEDGPARVASFYAGHWRARRFYVRDDVTHRGGVVSAVDGQQGRVYQALIMVRKGRTVVFPSVTTSPTRAMESLDEPSPVPLFPESKAIINLGSKEGRMGARVILSVNDGGLEPNLAHYRRVLREAGYEPDSKKDQPIDNEHRVLLYRKEGGEVTVNLSALGGKRVRVHIMVVGS